MVAAPLPVPCSIEGARLRSGGRSRPVAFRFGRTRLGAAGSARPRGKPRAALPSSPGGRTSGPRAPGSGAAPQSPLLARRPGRYPSLRSGRPSSPRLWVRRRVRSEPPQLLAALGAGRAIPTHPAVDPPVGTRCPLGERARSFALWLGPGQEGVTGPPPSLSKYTFSSKSLTDISLCPCTVFSAGCQCSTG